MHLKHWLTTSLVAAGLLLGGLLGMARWSGGIPAATQAEITPPASAPASQPAQPFDPARLRLLAANIRLPSPADKGNTWAQRRELLASTLLQHNPDIIACQEVSPAQASYLISTLKGYAYLPTGDPESGLLGPLAGTISSLNAIFYRTDRFELLEQVHGPLRPDAPQNVATENAFYTLAVLRDRAKRFPDLVVVNTHLRHDPANAAEGAKRVQAILRAKLAAYPGAQGAVLGDMNFARGTPVYAALTAGDALRDVFDYTAKKTTDKWGTYHAFSGTPAAEWPSDLIFLTPGLKHDPARILRDHNAAGHYPSDHFFIETVLTTFRP